MKATTTRLSQTMFVRQSCLDHRSELPAHQHPDQMKATTTRLSQLHVPAWINSVSFLSLLIVGMQSFRPLLARELLLKYSIRLNKYNDRVDLPTHCPFYADLLWSATEVSGTMYDIDFERYQGEWFSYATNDPTLPSGGICQCDRFNWTYNQRDGSFKSKLDIKCNQLGAFQMDLFGQTNVTGIPGTIREGSPSFGAKLIPGYILWVDDEYNSTIRYFCQEEYLGVPVFSSVQIWTRKPCKLNSEEGRRLIDTAHRVMPIPFDEKYLEFADHTDCKDMPHL